MKPVTENAFAKVNLHLAVLDKRSDGYHEIQSLMCPVSYSDRLRIISLEKRRKERGCLRIDYFGKYKSIFDELSEEQNLVYKAFREYFANCSFDADLKVELVKNIPAGAGLAGGSSDAAAMLRLLNRVFHRYSKNQMLRIAERIGADVPFCLVNKTSLCSGKGEVLVPLRNRLIKKVLIICNDYHVSTKEAYDELDKRSLSRITLPRRIFESSIRINDFSPFSNDFEKIVFQKCPEVGKIKEELILYNPDHCVMTGSGSSVIALFSYGDDCEKAYASMKQKGYSPVIADVIY